MHDFVFISHSNADKPRIKVIVDRLIASGLKVWLDRPEEMGYSAAEVEQHFNFIPKGAPDYRVAISQGTSWAGCLLLLASAEVVARERTVWHREIDRGLELETLIPVRLEPVRLEDVPLPSGRKLATQSLKAYIPHDITEKNLSSEQNERIEHIVKAAKDQLDRVRRYRYGRSPQHALNGSQAALNAAQLQSLMTLLGRENEVTLFVRGGAASVLTGSRSAKVDYLLQRLRELELPCRHLISQEAANFRNLEAIRSDALTGQIDVGAASWEPIYVPWPSNSERKPGNLIRTFLLSLFDKLGVADEPPNDPVALADRMQQLHCRGFVYTDFLNDKSGRAFNQQLIFEISKWFISVPNDRIRLAIHALPQDSWWFRSPTSWLNSACASGGTTAIELGDVARNELRAWEEILSRVVETARGDISISVESAFPKRAHRTSIEALEQKLRPVVSQWPLRPAGKPPGLTNPSRKWQDAYV